MRYVDITLTDEDIQTGAYKRFFGGKDEAWRARGAFQLQFLRSKGLLPTSKCLDIGCGPLRAGVHIINYLRPGGYFGYDENPSFIAAGRQAIVAEGLEKQRPTLAVVDDFLCPYENRFDFGIAFSVLNHCQSDKRKDFFKNAPRAFRGGGRVFVTHADWFRASDLDGSAFQLADTVVSTESDLAAVGWGNARGSIGVLPILEFTVA